MNIKHITEDSGQITAILREGNYLWIGYILSGVAKLRKVSALDPTSIYFDITISNSTKINKIIDIGTYISLAVDSDSYIGVTIHKFTPLTTYWYHNKPGTVTENAISVAYSPTYLYFLTPGVFPIKSKLLKINYGSSTVSSSIDIEKDGDIIYDARDIDIDSNDNLWVVTYTNPIKLVKINTTPTVQLIRYLG